MTYWDKVTEWFKLLPYWARQLGPEYWSHTYGCPEAAVQQAIRKTNLARQVDEMLCPVTRWVTDHATAVSIQAKDRRQAQLFFRSVAENLRKALGAERKKLEKGK